MAETQAAQTQKAFQKQDAIFVGKRRVVSKKNGKKSAIARYFKNVGLGFKTPHEAKYGTYIDKHCPFTGNVNIRGRILTGKVASTKMERTITVRRDYLHYIKKYNRFEKRHKMVSAHISPCFRVEEGDDVTIGQCRPLAKTVRFNVLKVDTKGSAKGVKLFTKN